MMTGMWHCSPFVPGLMRMMMPLLPSGWGTISICSVDWRASQPLSLRILNAPTGLPVRSAIFSSRRESISVNIVSSLLSQRFSTGQEPSVSAMMRGKISSVVPRCLISPPPTTMISSAS